MNFGIIAAGEGSRLATEGVSLPKPLVPINGIPMIGRLFKIFDSLGAGKISVIVNEYMTEVAAYVSRTAPLLNAEVKMVVKTTPSSMHSFYELGRLMRGDGRFVLTTVDTIFREADFQRYVEAWRNAPANVRAMMAVTRFVDDEKPLYVKTTPDMHVSAFLDADPDGTAEYVSGGIYGLDDGAIDALNDCLERGVSRMRNYQRALLESGLEVKAFNMGKILDVDHAGDIEKAERFLKTLKTE
ncbi:MAG: NTP transferase domain-containing protein [Candidatus Amulumruptor caecigallinarius]|nr:NTP transferase domain-containing protein [Candidatus Amulumruptor caecigallinarius]